MVLQEGDGVDIRLTRREGPFLNKCYEKTEEMLPRHALLVRDDLSVLTSPITATTGYKRASDASYFSDDILFTVLDIKVSSKYGSAFSPV